MKDRQKIFEKLEDQFHLLDVIKRANKENGGEEVIKEIIKFLGSKVHAILD